MDPDPKLVDVLKRLSAGEWDPEEWIEWWAKNAEWVASQVNRGRWLRLRPPSPGGFGPPVRCALVSQQGAIQLLDQWGIEHASSDRYNQEWSEHFEGFVREKEQSEREERKQLRPRSNALKVEFPKLARFLGRNLDALEELGEPATNDQIRELERKLGSKLPTSFQTFLSCTNVLVYGDDLQIGLGHTFIHPGDTGSPGAGRVCFGEYWLKGDGDQVLFGDAAADQEPPVLYYNHSNGAVRPLADDFRQWLESLPRALKD